MQLDKAFERYLRHHRAEDSSPKTLEWHTYSLRQFIAYLAAEHHSGAVGDLCAEDLRGYIDYLRGKGLAQTLSLIHI